MCGQNTPTAHPSSICRFVGTDISGMNFEKSVILQPPVLMKTKVLRFSQKIPKITFSSDIMLGRIA